MEQAPMTDKGAAMIVLACGLAVLMACAGIALVVWVLS